MKRGRTVCVFVGAAIVGLLAAVICFVSFVNWAGLGYCPYSFVPPYHLYKCERLKRATSPKIVFWGGSSAHETLLPEVVSRELGMDVVLAGTIWVMPMRFLPAMLENTLHAGDVLCLMLEFKEYERATSEILSPFGVSMLLGVDASLRRTFRPRERFDLYLRKGLGWLQCVVPKRIPHCQFPRYRAGYLYDAVQRWPGKFEGLGTYGEDAKNHETTCAEDGFLPYPSRFSEEFRQSFEQVAGLVRSRGAKLVIANASSYSYLCDVGAARFCEEQGNLGVPVCCSLLELCFPYGFCSDGILHCNGMGKRFVTRQIVRGLKKILFGTVEKDGPWPLQFFAADRADAIAFELPAECRGRETFAELILDRGRADVATVVSNVFVNGRAVGFSERVHPAKNTLWMHWPDASGRADIRIEFSDRQAGCRGERVLVEPYRFDELRRIRSFNDQEGFVRRPDNSARFVATAHSGHLAFRIPDWMSCRYRLKLKVRLDKRIDAFKCGGRASARRLTHSACGENDIAELKIVPNASDGFVDEKGDAVFGLWFEELPSDATVELVSCEFDML